MRVGLTGLGRGDQGRETERGGDVCVGTGIGSEAAGREHTFEAIGVCRGRTDNEARLVASSESVSRVLEIHMLDRATRRMMSMMPGTDACSKRRGRVGTQD